MIDGDSLYQSQYNGSIWGWDNLGVSQIKSLKTNNVDEIFISYNAFSKLAGRIKVGYKDMSESNVISCIPVSKSPSAVFVIDSLIVTKFKIITSAGEGGTIDSTIEVVQGTNVTINITPFEDYYVSQLQVDNRYVDAKTSYKFINVQSDHKISATFRLINKKQITLSPYLINYGPGTIDILFRTKENTYSATVDWGTSMKYENTSGSLVVNSSLGQNRYQYRMSGLIAGTKYYYRVTVDTSILVGSFYPAPADAPDNFSFYAIGDTQDSYGWDDDGIWPPNMGKDEVAHAIYNDIQNDTVARQTFMLYAGDLNDNYEFENWYGCFFNPFNVYASWLNRNTITIAAQGNHDGANTDYSKFNDFFPLSHTDEITSGGGYYSVNYGSVHVVVIDPFNNKDWSDEGGAPLPGEPQWEWLSNDLQQSQANPAIKFTVCIYHTPAYTLTDHSDNLVMQNVSNQLFEQYGVDICLSGHNHYYARAFVDNIYHLTLGSGGATQGSSALDPVKYPFVTEYHNGTFFTKFTVTGNQMLVQAYKHIGDGEIELNPVDSFTINASDN